MSAIITPAELPDWVPCRVQAASDALGWNNVVLRSYHQAGHDVELPGVRDFLVVAYRAGVTPMQRRFEGRWTKTTVTPGDFSLLTRSQRSHWYWTQDIDVHHVYLSERLVSDVAREMFDRDVAEIHLHDLLKASDPVVSRCVEALACEARQLALGGSLYAEALGTELSVHLLRHYSAHTFRERTDQGCLSPSQRRRVVEYIEDRLHESLTLPALASVANLGVCTFVRRFRQSFGRTPHAYVLEQRVVRARRLLEEGSMSLKELASVCGFADQSHMTRVFRSQLQTTPAAHRRGRSL